MGKHFGNLAKIVGVSYFKISQYEQRYFAGFFTKRLVNTIRRIREQVVYIGVPTAIAYTVYEYGTTTHQKLMRKNPADYEHDE